MNIALTPYLEGFIRSLVARGRYNNASEVARAALRNLEVAEGECFPAGSLSHLYTGEAAAEEMRLASQLPQPTPDEV